MIRGRRAHGAALATLPTCAHLSPDSQRLHRAGSVPCKPKTLKMSAYGTFSPTARPPRVLPTPWALPTPAFATWQGCRENLLHPYHRALSPPTCKGCRYAVASQALTGFQLRPLRLVLLPPRRWRGVKGDEVVHFTLDALNRPNTHRRGRWIGFATCPCGLASESGVWGKAPRACFLFLKLLGGCNRSKRSKKCAFLESLLLKTPQIWPISDPTPTLTGGE